MIRRTIDGTRAAGGVRMGAALAGLALVAGAAGSAGAQETAMDPRWQAWAGCWAPGSDSSTPIAENAPVVCVVPMAGGSRAELVAVAEGKVVARELVVATGERQRSERDGCEGWETAEWSADGHRIYRRSEHACANGVRRVSNGVIAMGTQGEWLDIRGVGLQASAGVVAVRYRPTATATGLPAELAARLPAGGAAPELRLAAGAPLAADAVVEVAQKLDLPVAEALLIERGQGFQLDGRRLVALADRGVPSRLIDAMVALSYPKVFAVNARTRSTDRVAAGTQVAGGAANAVTSGYGWTPWGWSPYAWGGAYGFTPFGYRYGYGYAGGFSPWGMGFYGNGGPIIIVRGDGNTAPPPRGRAVNGRGYTQGGGSGGARPSSGNVGGGYSNGGSSSGGASSGGSSSGGSSSGGGGGRTAQPRNP